MTAPQIEWSGGSATPPPPKRSLALRVAGWWLIAVSALGFIVGLYSAWAAIVIADEGCGDGVCDLLAETVSLFLAIVAAFGALLGVVGVLLGRGVLAAKRGVIRATTVIFGAGAVLCVIGAVFHLTRPEVNAASGYLFLALLCAVPAFLPLTSSARAEWDPRQPSSATR